MNREHSEPERLPLTGSVGGRMYGEGYDGEPDDDQVEAERAQAQAPSAGRRRPR